MSFPFKFTIPYSIPSYSSYNRPSYNTSFYGHLDSQTSNFERHRSRVFTIRNFNFCAKRPTLRTLLLFYCRKELFGDQDIWYFPLSFDPIIIADGR